jgi:membrane protein DedA with SNARE-associated domain
MDWLTDWLIGFASDRNHPAGLALLGGSALLEYIFPPIPGDTITLFGAVLISGFGWSWIGIIAVILAGSLAGAALTFLLGRRLRARGHHRPAVDKLLARFERHGPTYLVVNRFVPGVRALAFLAAGMSHMRTREVFLWGGTSIVLWNGLLIGLGAAVGANLETLERWVREYTTGAWIALGAALVGFVVWRLVVRHRRRRQKAPPVE